jgi:hypothetical protein
MMRNASEGITMPFYQVDEKGSDKPRLVEADNPAAALKHAAKSRFTVSKPLVATALVALMGSGVAVEKAGTEPVEVETAAK